MSDNLKFFTDETAPKGTKTLGGPPYLEDGTKIFCPLCQTEIMHDDVGFGLAYGGYGTYYICSNEACQWWFKELADDDE